MRRAVLIAVLLAPAFSAPAALAQGHSEGGHPQKGPAPKGPNHPGHVHRRPTQEEVEQVRTIVGPEAWGLMAEWRRRDVVHRYLRFQRSSARQQESIRSAGLSAYLTSSDRRRGPKLSPELQELIERIKPDQRRAATKIFLVRTRQRRLDRNLALLPRADRMAWFQRLFPEPFNPATARAARLDFEKQVAGGVARSLRPKMAALKDLGEDERRARTIALVRNDTERREKRLLAAVVKDLKRLERQAGGKLDPEFELILGRGEVFATPRQRELLRWALRPANCPLLDFGWMGKRPKDRESRRQWDRDVSTLGRMELLTKADFPPDVVLHLAATGSSADLMRAARHLLGESPGGRMDRPNDHDPGRRARRREKER